MNETSSAPAIVVNVDELPEQPPGDGYFGAVHQLLTPSMRPRGGKLGIRRMRLSQGRTTCPFHHHLREDEAFFVLSGRGVLRYGETIRLIRAGDCVSCPAGTGIAHQIANPFEEDLVYLAAGVFDPHEVCVYPDTGKLMIRGISRLGELSAREYLEGEPTPPTILALAAVAVQG